MNNALTEAREAFNKLAPQGDLADRIAQAFPITGTVSMEKNPTAEPIKPKVEVKKELVLKAPSESESKKVYKKPAKKKVVKVPGKIQQMGIKQSELDKTNVYWNSQPTAQVPLVRGALQMLSINPDGITTDRAEKMKEVLEIGAKELGTDDAQELFTWIKKMMEKFKVSGDRKEAQLLMMLRMR